MRTRTTTIGDAIKAELMKHPESLASIRRSMGATGGRFTEWINGRSDMLLSTAERYATELGYRIMLERIEQ